jgi:hypothetical protein
VHGRHRALVAHFNLLLSESLVERQARPITEVAD